MIKENLTGREFNSWKVLSYLKGGYWKCQCLCGNTGKVQTWALTHGGSKQCKPCSVSLPDGESSFNKLFSRYKRSAKHGNKEFSLSKQQVRQLFLNNCEYCGSKPTLSYNDYKTPFVYNGIDRVDNSKGYTLENCVSCCKICNYMKNILSQDEFFKHLKKIVDYRGLDEF